MHINLIQMSELKTEENSDRGLTGLANLEILVL